MSRVFPEPPHEIRGATPTDQAWIDETVEAGSTCCNWAVKPRPLGLDSRAAVSPAKQPEPVRAAPNPKKKSLWKRLRKGAP